MNVKQHVMVGCLLALSLCVHAANRTEIIKRDDGTQALIEQLETLKTLQADFRQRTVNGGGARVQESAGSLLIKRPDLFRWQVNKPFTQVTVTDKNSVRMYDKDLAQVVIQKLDKQLDSTPALLLSGNTAKIKQVFQVSMEQKGASVHYILTPKAPDSVFNQLVIGFDHDRLETMLIVDSLGAHTRIGFSQVVVNHALSDQQFQLALPKGVDIIDERKQ